MFYKSKFHRFADLSIILALTISFGSSISVNGGSTPLNDSYIMTNGMASNLGLSPQVTTATPIIIDGNSDFHSQAAIEGWNLNSTRDGSLGAPYLLNNLVLSVGGAADGITILRTNVYFILSNSYITDVTGWSAVNLTDVSNAVITNNEVAYSSRGIAVTGGSNVMITNNNVHNNAVRGINLIRIQGITVSDNTVSLTGAEGIVLESGAYNNVIRNNHVFDNNDGIVVWAGASGNQILSNKIENNNNRGIFLEGVGNTIVQGNTLANNANYGIDLKGGTILANVRWNNFINNNATLDEFNDDGTNNVIELNYIEIYDGEDLDTNLIFDSPYITTSGDQDPSPLAEQYTGTAPTILNLTNPVQYKPVQLSWTIGSNSYNHSVTSSLYYSTDFGLSWSTIFTDYIGQSYLWYPTKVLSGSSVQIKVVTQTSELLINSTVSNTFQVFNPTLPSDPKNVLASENSGTVDLSWSQPNDFGTFNVTSYSVYRGSNSGSMSFLASTTNLFYTDFGVNQGLTYLYAIAASSLAGNGNLSVPVSVTIPDTVSPTFTVDVLSSGITELTGEATFTIIATDNVEVARVELYLIIDGVESLLANLTDSPYQLVLDTTTIEDGTYTLRITVFDKAGNTIMVNYAITVENESVSVSSSFTSRTTQSQTSSASNSENGVGIPLPFDMVSSLLALISLTYLLFIRRRIIKQIQVG